MQVGVKVLWKIQKLDLLHGGAQMDFIKK